MTQKNIRLTGPLPPGKTRMVLEESLTGSGTVSREFSLDADTVLLSAWVSATSGDVDIVAETFNGDGGGAVDVITFPTISAPTTGLLLRKAATALSLVRVRVTYTGDCDVRIDAKGLGTGEASVRIQGAEGLITSQANVSTTASLLIASSLSDRQGIMIKNWAGGGNLFIAETEAKATAGEGWPMATGDAVFADVVAGQEIWAVADAGTIDVRIIEAGE